MLPSSFSAAANHLLAQESWARDKLARHAGKVACFDAGVTAVRVTVAADGMLQAATDDQPVNVTIRARLSDLPLIAQNRERAFSYVRIEGDADFANTISQLGQSLRWEAEADLARWIGDIPAMRVVAGARAAAGGVRSAGQALTENLAEYLLEENPMLVRRGSVADFGSEVARLRDDVERLSKRIEKLSGSR